MSVEKWLKIILFERHKVLLTSNMSFKPCPGNVKVWKNAVHRTDHISVQEPLKYLEFSYKGMLFVVGKWLVIVREKKKNLL